MIVVAQPCFHPKVAISQSGIGTDEERLEIDSEAAVALVAVAVDIAGRDAQIDGHAGVVDVAQRDVEATLDADVIDAILGRSAAGEAVAGRFAGTLGIEAAAIDTRPGGVA